MIGGERLAKIENALIGLITQLLSYVERRIRLRNAG